MRALASNDCRTVGGRATKQIGASRSAVASMQAPRVCRMGICCARSHLSFERKPISLQTYMYANNLPW